jgi:NAD(P)-dependent dehydrogenase (short-subunit alcohol dehydrogenase family)
LRIGGRSDKEADVAIAVTGSASGIGRAVRQKLEAGGRRVIGVDVRDAEIVADLASEAGRRAAVGGILAAAAKLEGFVACAGVGPASASAPLIVSVNYFGAVEMLDGLKDALGAGAPSSAVAVASNSATTVGSLPNDLVSAMLDGDESRARARAADVEPTTAYAASKLALARAIRRRAPGWASAGIRLNAVAPGAVDTPLLEQTLADPRLGPLVRDFPIPCGRFGAPGEIADAIAFLLGPEGAFCCGTVLFVDGGTDALVRGDVF